MNRFLFFKILAIFSLSVAIEWRPLEAGTLACQARAIEAARQLEEHRVLSAFMKRFHLMESLSVWHPETWRSFLSQVSRIDFSKPPPYSLDLVIQVPTNLSSGSALPVNGRRFFRISHSLVEGWRLLGLIDSSGRWNLELQPEELAANFLRVTGRKLVFSSEPRLMGHLDYVREVRLGHVPMEELHDLIFHAAWLTNPLHRELFDVLATFDEFMNIEDGSYSLLNSAYEGEFWMGASSTLVAPLQLANDSLAWKPPSRPYVLTYLSATRGLEAGQREYASLRERRDDAYRLVKNYDIKELTEMRLWWLVLVHVERELVYQVSISSQRHEPQELLSKVRELRQRIEADPHHAIRPSREEGGRWISP